MVTGVTGSSGLAAPRHVDLGQEAEKETVTTQLQLMVAETVKDQAMSLVFATQTLVQVNHVLLISCT